MPSRRRFLTGCTALGLPATLPGVGTVSAADTRPKADIDAALDAFGAGAVDGRVTPAGLTRIDDALDAVADEAPETAATAADRVPAVPFEAAAAGELNGLADADLYAAVDDPATAALDGVASIAVAVDFTARGPVLRARVAGTDGAPARADARTALSAAGFPAVALEDAFAVPDDGAVTLTAGFADRDRGQPVVLFLFVVVLAAVLGTFVLGLPLGGGGGSRETAPQVSFEFELSTDGGLTITHHGGDTVDSGQLTVQYVADGSQRIGEWTEPDGDIAAGDTFTTDARPDSESRVRVVWTSEEGSQSATLAEYTVP